MLELLLEVSKIRFGILIILLLRVLVFFNTLMVLNMPLFKNSIILVRLGHLEIHILTYWYI